MGTSSSSAGPKGGVPFDPPWLSEIDTEHKKIEKNDQDISCFRRFSTSRRYLGEYLKRGDISYLRKALGSYSQHGMGGATRLAHRMSYSSTIGAEFFSFLKNATTTDRFKNWIKQLHSEHLNIHEVADVVVSSIIQHGGSLDEESCRRSMSQALSDFMAENDADLTSLSENDIWTIIEKFICNEVFDRICIDIGRIFESKNYSVYDIIEKNKEIQDYLEMEISSQIVSIRLEKKIFDEIEMKSIIFNTIKNTFLVFEEYL